MEDKKANSQGQVNNTNGFNSAEGLNIHQLIRERVQEVFDQSDKITRHVIKIFLETYQMSLDKGEEGHILHRVVSQQAIDAIVQVHQVKVECAIAKTRMEILKQKFELAQNQEIQTITECEDIEMDEDWHLNIHCLILVREKKDEDEQQTVTKLLDIAWSMTDGSLGHSLESIQEGSFPKNWDTIFDKYENIQTWFSDLADFLITEGGKGGLLVKSICKKQKDSHPP